MRQSQGAKIILMFILAGVIPASAKAPSWFSENILKKNGKTLEVSCSGAGPDKAVASKVGIDQCRGVSLQYVEGYTVKTRSLFIEDNQQAAWHSESSNDLNVSGLNCEPLKQDCQEHDDSWTCYLLCRFNLANAKLIPNADKASSFVEFNGHSLISNHDDATSVPNPKGTTAKNPLIQSQNRQIILSIVPSPCDSILVVGQSRVIKCSDNPQTLLLLPDDKELIVQMRGYKPKHIYLRSDRTPTGYMPIENVEVYLEKL
jgi:hypothetical protein